MAAGASCGAEKETLPPRTGPIRKVHRAIHTIARKSMTHLPFWSTNRANAPHFKAIVGPIHLLSEHKCLDSNEICFRLAFDGVAGVLPKANRL